MLTPSPAEGYSLSISSEGVILFQFVYEHLQFVDKSIIAVYLQVIAHSTTVGREGLEVWYAVELEQFAQFGEVLIGYAHRLLVCQPLGHVFLVGFL